jgi:hypothetical protein
MSGGETKCFGARRPDRLTMPGAVFEFEAQHLTKLLRKLGIRR